ncbi:YD repeat-containing protein [Akanthomyces lecanii RCEF 1005]|uniref:YD repeat-containing protein n=1 Tax=Akanthomyces lecanii RCEF 1005 TaxID=1081108 RepID=A0A168BF47_CORDF|nr:YD repeat-containing protein [Akanthomyces lecanii RCEF 1005]
MDYLNPPLDNSSNRGQASGQVSTGSGREAGESSNPSSGEAPSPFTLPSVQLPKGGGGIKGIGEKFSVSPATGTGNFSVPIKTSNGRAGSSVALSLSYNSGAGNGSFGLGWQVSNQSIVRKTDKGLPRYRDEDESDVFMLAGVEDLVPSLEVQPDGTVIPVSESRYDGNPLLRSTRYQPRIDNGSIRVLRISNQETDESHWEVKTGANLTTIYGDCDESRVFDPLRPSRIFEWLPTRSFDDKGNETLYQYKVEDSCGIDTASSHEQQRSERERSAARYIKRIKYGNTISNLNPAFKSNNNWLFEVVFDYGEHDRQNPSVEECKEWQPRPDPFSTRRAGFEIRTYRLCQRVLMFHHFPDEPTVGRDCLVASFNLTHEAIGKDPSTGLAVASIVTSVTQESWQRCGDTYKKQFMPPLEFRYSAAQPARQSEALKSSSLANLPAGFSGDYQVLDLEGQGLPGVVVSVGGNLLYVPNFGNGHFGRAETLPSSPGAGSRRDARQWMDLDGGGKLDFVQMNAPTPGFYKRNLDENSGWDTFRTFESFPNLDMKDKNLKFIDLTGDGIADIVIIDDNELRFYAGLGDVGFDTPSYKPSPLADETLDSSRLLFWDGSEAIYTSDMTGDGLADLVRVRNSEICYWPNLGYGEFGAKVAMVNPPVFDRPDLFSQTYLLLSDIDGSGTTDVVYLGNDVPMIYHNLSGNGWSDGIPITGFPGIDSTTNVRVSDLLGRGTGCLVWSSILPGDFGHHIRYLDLMEAGKPYLLVGVDNNMGWETRVTYESSCQFYARDKSAGRPWTARLPFPVQCVEKAELVDRVSKSLFTTKYAYHDGYFDGVEREFRGFGMVESWDTELYSNLQQDNTMSNISKQSNMPPVLTKTWYHTGEYLDGKLVTRYSDIPYWTGDDQIQSYASLTDPVLPFSITTKRHEVPYTLNHQERREACRALRGQVLRSESYAIDGTNLQAFPYIVQESNMHLELRQPVGPNSHAVLFVRPKESLEMAYDRKRYRAGSIMQFDPRISHTMVLETNFYGNQLKSMVVSYGRRHPDPDKRLTEEDRKAQMRSHAVLSTAAFTNSVETRENFILPLPAQSQSYEVINIDACRRRAHSGAKEAVLFDDALQIVRRLASGAFDIPFENFTGPYSSSTTTYRRLLKESCSIYRKNDLTGPLPLGVVESLSLPWKNFQLSLTDDQAQHYVTSGKIRSEELIKTLEKDCNFSRIHAKPGWWAPSGQAFFAAQRDASPSQELEEAKRHFFTIRRSRPQFDRDSAPAEVFYDYDKYDLLIQEVRDPYGNTVTAGERNVDPSLPLAKAGNDYRLLAPFLVMDSNRNRSKALFNIMGNVVASAAMGKPEENLGDSLDGVHAVLNEDETREFFNNPTGLSHKYLGKATTRTVYDFFAYHRTKHHRQPQPNWVSSLSRETHESDVPEGVQSRVFVTVSYSDGLGRGIQVKAQCESGPLTLDVSSGVEGGLAIQPKIQQRWLTSSWVIFNNKNKPVRQYEPFFSGSHRFQDKAIYGVSSIMLYDAIARPVAVVSPDHTWSKVKHDPWGSEQWDKIDTVLIEDPSTDEDVGGFFKLLPRAAYMPTWYGQRCHGQLGTLEKEAAMHSASLAETPSSVKFDSLGRACVSFEVLRHPQPSTSTSTVKDQVLRQPSFLDVQGMPVKLEDSLGRETATNIFAIGGWIMSETHMDNGTRWTLPDVSGIPILTWNARGQRFRTEYDRKRRIVGLHIRDGENESLVEASKYGETGADPELYNANGRIVLAYDQTGTTRTPKYDFKGNLGESTRQLACDYKTALDWSSPQKLALQEEEFVETVSYDALGKPTKTILPDGTMTSYHYNERGLIRKVETNVKDAASVDSVIDDIEYDAKGQRSKIRQGNGMHTLFHYDKNTFRVCRIETIRVRKRSPSRSRSRSQSGNSSEGDHGARPRRKSSHRERREHLQDLNYVFDALGNITHVTDKASQPIFFRNHRVEAMQTFTYDSLARLVEATGREHIGQMHMARDRHGAGNSTPSADGRVDHPNDAKAMGRYVEKYVYDAVNNIQSLRHANLTDGQSYTRRYYYEEKSLVAPSQQNNRLSRTSVGDVTETYHYDGSEAEPGNMSSMPGLPSMVYDYGERMVRSVQTCGKGSEARETIYYRYDATGKRVRKVIERQAESEKPKVLKETIYIGGAFEVFRKYAGGGDVSVEVHSLRIIESGRQLLLVEKRTLGGDSRAPGLLYRYQLGNFQGSATVEVDENANVLSYEEFTPYGVSSVSSVFRETEVPKRYRFLGKERDETGLYHFGVRYYAPWLGRFVSADPKGSADGSNLYQYAHGNPTMLADPSGTNANPPPEFAGWAWKDIAARANDKIHLEDLNLKGGGALIQQYRVAGRAAAGDFAKFLQSSLAEGSEMAVKFETYLANAKTGGVKGSSYIDFIVQEWKTAYEHKLLNFSKYSEDGSLVLDKLKDASSRIITQLNKHTTNLAQLGDDYGKVRLAVTLRGLEGATEQGLADFAGELGTIMKKAGQLEPLIQRVDSPGIVAATQTLESGTLAVIERAGGLSKYVGTGSKILGPLGVFIGVMSLSGQAHAATGTGEHKGISKSEQAQAGMDLAANVTGIGVFAVGAKATAITAAGGATLATGAAIVAVGAAAGGAAAGAAVGGWVDKKVESSEWAQQNLGPKGAELAGYGTGVLAGAAAGAAVGALVGSVLPIVGTAAGAVIGGAAGALGAEAKILISKYWN